MRRTGLATVFAVVAMTGCGAGGVDPAASGDGMAEAPQDLDDEHGAKAPVARACARMHGECSAICDNVWAECYDDVATCTEQWYADYLEEFDAPMVDAALVSRCAEQVEAQPCTNLEPDTAECDYAVVERCLEDTDDYGTPYSPFWAHPVQAGELLEPHLCAYIEEYYAIELRAGDVLDVERSGQGPAMFEHLLRMTTNTEGDALLERIDTGNPVPLDGTYVLVIESFERSQPMLELVLTRG